MQQLLPCCARQSRSLPILHVELAELLDGGCRADKHVSFLHLCRASLWCSHATKAGNIQRSESLQDQQDACSPRISVWEGSSATSGLSLQSVSHCLTRFFAPSAFLRTFSAHSSVV